MTGTINGTVTDKSGGALPGATVTIRNMETGLERVVVTNELGYFNAPFLPIGKYRVQAELEGLGRMARQNVRVDLNSTTVQNFALAATMAETITVTAEAPHVNVTDGEVKQTLRSEEIMTMPMPVPNATASFLRLASVFSGYQENPTSGQDNPTLSSGSSINFNGTGTRGNTFQINGVNNDDSSENQHRQGVALATIKSFQVLTNNFSAEFGRGYGGVILIQTKSGTNNIDGEVYGAGTEGKWNALDWFSAQANVAKPDNFRRTYGMTAGFPVMRDILFGYANYEYTQNLGKSLRSVGLFTDADLALPRLTLGNDTPANRAWQDSILARWPKGLTPNNPAIGSRAYTYPYSRTWPDREASMRLDYNINNSNSANIRYQKNHQIRQNSDLIIGEMTAQNNTESSVGLEYVSVLTSNTVQEFRYGLGLRSTNVGILAGNDTPIVRFSNLGFTFTTLGNAGSYPINRNQRDQQLTYNISSTHFAKHTMKAGFDIRRSQLNDKADNYSRGYWVFNNGTRCGVTFANAIEAFMAGCPSNYTIAYGPFSLQNSIDEANLYAQDDWRPFDSLTLNLGVRYERAGVPKEDHNLIQYTYKTTDYVDPRLGFAYTPDWDQYRILRAVTGGAGRFSIRGGYGVSHGRVFQSVFSQGGFNVRFNPPNAAEYWMSGAFTQMPGAVQSNVSDPTNGFKFVPGTIAIGSQMKLIDPNLSMPETRNWNLTFERQIFGQQRLRLSYIGNLGRNLLRYQYTNLPVSPYAPGSKYTMAADWLCAGTGYTVDGTTYAVNAQCPNKVPLGDTEVSYRVQRVTKRRPDPNYGTNTMIMNGAKSWYNAAQIEWETGIVRGFNSKFTYTYGKAFDTNSEATSMGTPSAVGDSNFLQGNDERYTRGPSHFDTRHRITLVASYELPWFKQSENTLLRLALGGWQISTVARYATGTPFTIMDSGEIDYDLDGYVNGRPVVVDPNYRSGSVNSRYNSQANMPPSAWRRATNGDTIDMLAPRNSYYGPPIGSIDLGLYKAFDVMRGNTLIVRLDAFNVTNRVLWGFPVMDIASANFGKITSTGNYTPRLLQVGFRWLY